LLSAAVMCDYYGLSLRQWQAMQQFQTIGFDLDALRDLRSVMLCDCGEQYEDGQAEHRFFGASPIRLQERLRP